MIIKDAFTSKEFPQKVSNYIINICGAEQGECTPSDMKVLSAMLTEEYKYLRGDYSDWIATVKLLDAIPTRDFFLGAEKIKIFDVEERIETDTSRAKVITYSIADKDLVKQILRSKRNGKTRVLLKFISPRVMDELVSIRRFYRTVLKLCKSSIVELNNCRGGIVITNGTDKGSDSKQEQPSTTEASHQASG